MKDVILANIYVILRVMHIFWNSLEELFKSDFVGYKQIRNTNCSNENYFKKGKCQIISHVTASE
jgi:hypothetical protein